MNKTYRSVWNDAKGAWVAASENAKGRRKGGAKALAIAVVALGATGQAFAYNAGTGATVTSSRDTAVGDGSVAKTAGNMYWGSSVRPDGSAVAYTNYGSVALGYNANADTASTGGVGGVAIGDSATASSNVSTAIGTAATASGNGAVALGAGAVSSGYRSTAVGPQSEASGDYSAAFGQSSWAEGTNSVAVGVNSVASQANSMALGYGANSSATNSVALGANSTTTANLSAAGYNPGTAALSGTASTANGEVSVGSAGKERRVTNVAAGSAATDAVNVSQLMSEDAKVNSDGTATAAALGGGASYDASTGKIKAPTYVVQSGTFNDVGSALTKLDGATTKNAGDISTLNTTVNNITNGNAGIKYFHVNSSSADSNATGTNATAIGASATASGTNSIAQGTSAVSKGQSAIALGSSSSAAADWTFAAGNSASAVGAGDIALGASSTASGGGSYATALGTNATATAANAVAIGNAAKATATNSLALGANSTTTADLTAAGYNPGNSTLSGTASTANGEVSVGSAGKERRVTNVAAGSAATDAVNVSQLKSEDAKVNADGTATAAALGGGASYDASTGTIKAPTYVVQSGTFSDVGSALTKLDGATTKNTGDISTLNTMVNNITNGTAGLVQQNATTHAITVASATAGTTVDFTGTAGTRQLKNATTKVITVASATDGALVDFTGTKGTRQLTGVSKGAVDASSVDAINGAQLFAASQSEAAANSAAIGGGSQASGANSVAIGDGSIADQDNTVSMGSQGNERRITNVADGQGPTDAVNMRQFESGMAGVARNAYSGVAAATALSMIPDVDPNKTIAVGVGTGNYKGYQATALGASVRITQNLKMKIGGSVSSGGTTVGAGASYQW